LKSIAHITTDNVKKIE